MRKNLLVSTALSIAALGPVSPAWSATPPSPAALTWSLAQYDYGSVTPGQEGVQTFTLSNTGSKSSGTISITGGSPVFVITANGCTGKALGAGKSCNVTVEYAPSTTNGDTTTLVATSEYSNASMNLSGNGKPNLVLSVSPVPWANAASGFNFTGTQNGANEYIIFVDTTLIFNYTPFTVSNTGNGTSEVLSTTFITPYGPLGLSNTCNGVSLPPGGSCTFVYSVGLYFQIPGYTSTITVAGSSTGVHYTDLLIHYQ